MRWVAFLAVVMVGIATLAACEPEEPAAVGPQKVNYWEQRKGSCEQVLSAPHAYELSDLTRCMKIWETYRSITDLSVDMRSMYAVGFSLVWYKTTDDYDKQIAEAALARLCIPRHPMGGNGKIREEVPTQLKCGDAQVAGSGTIGPHDPDATVDDSAIIEQQSIADLRGSVHAPKANPKRMKKAKGFNKKGVRAASKKAHGSAIDHFEQALKLYPHYALAQYNMVCAFAQMGDDESALEELEKLYTWDDPQVSAQLIKARSDEDLLPLHDYMKFKQLTGYFRLTIANAAGEYGMSTIQRLNQELTTRRYAIYQVVENKEPRMVPEIWYKPGFEAYAEEFKLILGVRKVKLIEIDWETLDDMIIMWGMPEAAQLFAGDAGAAPIVQGTRAQEDAGGLDALTGAVQDTQGSVEGAVDTGKGVGDAVPAQ